MATAKTADFAALVTARHAVLARAGWKAGTDGMTGTSLVTIVGTEDERDRIVAEIDYELRR